MCNHLESFKLHLIMKLKEKKKTDNIFFLKPLIYIHIFKNKGNSNGF